MESRDAYATLSEARVRDRDGERVRRVVWAGRDDGGAARERFARRRLETFSVADDARGLARVWGVGMA